MMNREKDKKRVLDCLRERTMYPSEIADELKIDSFYCVELCSELCEDGILEHKDDEKEVHHR